MIQIQALQNLLILVALELLAPPELPLPPLTCIAG
jgi:hypothetical protein